MNSSSYKVQMNTMYSAWKSNELSVSCSKELGWRIVIFDPPWRPFTERGRLPRSLTVMSLVIRVEIASIESRHVGSKLGGWAGMNVTCASYPEGRPGQGKPQPYWVLWLSIAKTIEEDDSDGRMKWPPFYWQVWLQSPGHWKCGKHD